MAAGELAARLEKTVGRYERTGEVLKRWAPEAVDLQAGTLKARAKALDAEAMRASAPEQAETLLQEARADLERTLAQADTRDRYYSDQIEEATDDDIEDGRWGNFKDWVDRNAGWIKAATKILGYVATAVALVAIFIPGINALAIGLMFTVLAAHSLLAATGNGSLVDVGIDVVALATFGIGGAYARGLRATRQATRAAGTRAAGKAAENAARAQTQSARTTLGRIAAGGSGSRSQAARSTIRALKAEARVARLQAAREFAEAPLANPTWAERWAARDLHMARDLKDVRAIVTRFPGSAPVAAAADDAERIASAARTNWKVGAGVDFSDKFFDEGSPQYRAAKDRFVVEVGSTW